MNQRKAAMEATLSERTFNQLRTIIRERAGIRFRDNKRYLLESRVRPRLVARQMPDYETYVRSLQSGDPAEMRHLVNAVTINETSFFRHPTQFEALEQEVLPTLIGLRRQRGSRTMRLWSAACSTGEEAYTLAILVKERIQPRFPQIRFEIVATDIDTEVLGRARRGRYRARALRNMPTAYLHKYFQRSGDQYVLQSSVRETVAFRQLNLVDRSAVRRLRDVDLVLCANVLIYFNDAQKQEVLQSLYRSLRPGGYLFVGGSETLGGTSVPFVPERVAGALVYRRPPAPAASSSARSALGSQSL